MNQNYNKLQSLSSLQLNEMLSKATELQSRELQEVFYMRYWEPVLKRLYLRFGKITPDVALENEDILQDTFLRAFQKFYTYRQQEAESEEDVFNKTVAWLTRIAERLYYKSINTKNINVKNIRYEQVLEGNPNIHRILDNIATQEHFKTEDNNWNTKSLEEIEQYIKSLKKTWQEVYFTYAQENCLEKDTVLSREKLNELQIKTGLKKGSIRMIKHRIKLKIEKILTKKKVINKRTDYAKQKRDTD